MSPTSKHGFKKAFTVVVSGTPGKDGGVTVDYQRDGQKAIYRYNTIDLALQAIAWRFNLEWPDDVPPK